MKKIIAFALCLLVLAAIVRSIGPPTLTITVQSPDGRDITDQTRLLVGGAAASPTEAPGLGNVALVRADEKVPNRFDVPHDRVTAVFVSAASVEQQQFNFRLRWWENRHETIVLDVGWVNLETRHHDDQLQSVIDHLTDVGPRLKAVTAPATYMLPVGEHVFATAIDRETVTVIAGETTEVLLDNRYGEMTFNFAPAIPWADDYPPISYWPVEGGGTLHVNIRGRMPTHLPYGSHEMAVRLSPGWPLGTQTPSQSFEVHSPRVRLTVPFSVHVILPDVRDWTAQDLILVDAILFERSVPGRALAKARVIDGRAPLVVVPRDAPVDFAVALAKQRRIIGFVDVGAVPLDDPQDIAMPRGGDYAACVAIARGYDCETLRE